jgi:hypothetical protein
MAREIDFRSFNQVFDTPVITGPDGTRYTTKPVTVKAGAKFIEAAKEAEVNKEKLPEFVVAFAQLIGVPAELFDDMPIETFAEFMNSFFMQPDQSTDTNTK